MINFLQEPQHSLLARRHKFTASWLGCIVSVRYRLSFNAHTGNLRSTKYTPFYLDKMVITTQFGWDYRSIARPEALLLFIPMTRTVPQQNNHVNSLCLKFFLFRRLALSKNHDTLHSSTTNGRKTNAAQKRILSYVQPHRTRRFRDCTC